MKLRSVFLVVLLACFFLPTAAQEDIPLVAILKFGELRPFELSEQGSLDMFERYAYIEGENIEYIFGEAFFDITAAETLVANAIGEGADVIITITTPVTAAAVRLTAELENPPVIIFNTVTNPYAAGFAEAPCIKAENLTGSQAQPPLELILPMFAEAYPDAKNVGVIYNDNEANAVVEVQRIQEINVSENLGYDFLFETVASSDEVRSVAEAMLTLEVDAFLILTDSTVANATADISEDSAMGSIPVFSADVSQVYSGATVGIGLNYYQEGVDAARIAIAYLNGEVDIARTAINRQQGLTIAANLDAAEAQNVLLSEALLENLDYVIEDGESTEVEPSLPEMSLEEQIEADTEFLEGLYCTDEMIAEQQAALEETED
jgi:putative ABC transport system substrate-binding protein